MPFAPSSMQLTSPAFGRLGQIPKKHSGEGDNVSPPLAWSSVPPGTEAFALICHDPDAPVVTPGSYGFVHWVLYNIPATVTSLPEGVEGYTNGMTGFGKAGYGGPMPPEGHGVHHYYFWLIALNAKRNLKPGLSLAELLTEIEPTVIGMNRLIGTYVRGY